MSTFKNFRAAMTTGGVTAYTCPADTVARITFLQVASVDASNAADATVHWTDDSNADAVTRLCYQTEVAASDAISVAAGGLVLEAGDTIVATASADSDLELSGSVVETAV